ncbi:hypothetical protein INR49_032661 [Caranx melampygus]|nr:hypothetical protein INR49_032661 [Caranx melampygus]
MAPSARPSSTGPGLEDDESYYGIQKADRKMTVKKVEDILKNRSQETDALNREASERFAAGYIQCMHEVHMFVSSCPGIDATVAAELLNHLLECMPLNEDHLQDVLMDLITDTSGSNGSSTWHGGGEALCTSLASPGDGACPWARPRPSPRPLPPRPVRTCAPTWTRPTASTTRAPQRAWRTGRP